MWRLRAGTALWLDAQKSCNTSHAAAQQQLRLLAKACVVQSGAAHSNTVHSGHTSFGLELLLPQRSPQCDTSALLLDACGTLLVPSEPTADVYHHYAKRYCTSPLPKDEILYRYRRAYNTPWPQPIRYRGDARDFWRWIVQESTACNHEQMFEQIYQYYAQPQAWKVAPGAVESLQRLKQAGISLAVVSNFDTRLRPLLRDLGLADLFHPSAIICSAEVGCEKPNRRIFEAALDAVGVAPEEALHVGDDRRNDVWGARDAGVHAWLWGSDVTSFKQLADRVLSDTKYRLWEDDDPEPGEEEHAREEHHRERHHILMPAPHALVA